jgi:hypothetical protein
MTPGVKLFAALLLGMLVASAVTACGSSGDRNSACYVLTPLLAAEIKITGPNVDGCSTEIHKEVSAWEFLGLVAADPHFPLQYGAPAPTSAPVCTVVSREQTFAFYNADGKGAASYCKLLKNKDGLILWQRGQQAG